MCRALKGFKLISLPVEITTEHKVSFIHLILTDHCTFAQVLNHTECKALKNTISVISDVCEVFS